MFIGFFAFLLLLCGAMLFVSYRRAQAKIELAAEQQAKDAAAAVPVVSEEEQLAKKRAELGTIYEGAFADTKNGDDFVETPGYAKLIEVLALMSPEETAAKSTYVDEYSKLIGQPDLWRGEFVRVRGLIAGIAAVKLDNPVHDIRDVWRGSIDQPGSVVEPYVFDFIGQPPEFKTRETVVELDGLMYRMVGYESRTHLKQTAPYLLVRSIRTIEAKSEGGAETKFWTILIGLGVIVGYLFFRAVLRGQGRSNQGPSRLRAMLDERRHAHREKQT
jgi:hypothetical protein